MRTIRYLLISSFSPLFVLFPKGRRLAIALRDYGAYVVDSTNVWIAGTRADQDVDGAFVSLWNNIESEKVFKHLRVIENSAWVSGQKTVGGGEPIAGASNSAFDAQ